jgi:hypothetical protein
MMDFNVQTVLSEMQHEQNRRFDKLDVRLDRTDDKIDEIKTVASAHNVRIVKLESAHRLEKWLFRTAVAAIIASVAELIVHIKAH